MIEVLLPLLICCIVKKQVGKSSSTQYKQFIYWMNMPRIWYYLTDLSIVTLILAALKQQRKG